MVFCSPQGFSAVVEERSKYPLIKERSFLITPGHTTFASISATSLDASEGIKSIDPEKRNCYFEDEFPLKVHQNYTKANCLLECYLEYAFSHMEPACYPWYFN